MDSSAVQIRPFSGQENKVDADLQMGELQVVYLDESKGLAIVFGRALFMSGFNVYKKMAGSDVWEKANLQNQFFNSYRAAKRFLKKQ